MEEPTGYRRLLTLAGLPLLDGFFLSFLGAGLWRETGQALAFGLTAFSGAGRLIAALQLRGPAWQRAARNRRRPAVSP